MQNINPPKTCKKIPSFIGMINYYRDMRRGFSDLLASLSGLTSNKLNFKWKNNYQKVFDAVKIIIGREV